MGQPIVHFEIIGKDPKQLHDFYRRMFDWNVGEAAGPEMGHYAMVDASSSGLGLGIGGDPSGNSRTMAYVQVPDLKVALDKAVSLGGKVVMEPTEIPGVVTFATFADPQGNVIGLLKG